MEKILITGADGFIGSHLTEALIRKGNFVRAFVQYNFRNHWGWLENISPEFSSSIEIFSADLRDPFAVQKAVRGCARVFHLGALIAIPYSYTAPQDYVQTNILGTLNVLQASLEEKVDQVIHTSTSETYGTALYTPIDEKHPLQGQSPYSASKIGADKLAESYYLSFGLPVSTVRPFNTYGPRQSARAIIPTIISQALSQQRTIKLGSLDPVRDMNFVSDTVDGFIKAAETTASIGETINIGSGKSVTIGELAQIILKLTETDKILEKDDQRMRPEKSEVMKLICDNTKAKKLLGWKPTVDLEEGLKNTIAWFKDHLSFYKPQIFNQ